MTKWEYQLVHVGLARSGFHYIEYDHLETLGKQGWELIAIYDGIAYFKRPILPIVTCISSTGPKEATYGKETKIEKEAEEQEDKEDKNKQEIYTQSGELFHRAYRENL